MRSILLILGLTACVSGQKLNLSKELSISNKMLAQFKKELGGIDLEQRVLKFRILASKVEKQTKEQKKELKERLSKIKKTVIQKPPGVTANDIFEINKKSGIANFLYEGDINLTEEQLNQLTESVAGDSNVSGARVKRTPALRATRKWPNGIVYYYFDTNITQNQMKVDAIKAGLRFFEAKTCIRFVYSQVNHTIVNNNTIKRYLCSGRSKPRDGWYICNIPLRFLDETIILNGDGCWADIGMVGGEQIVSIGDECETIGKVAHEFAHALGFEHMQSRSDRDEYIIVDFSKIMELGGIDMVQRLLKFRNLAGRSKLAKPTKEQEKDYKERIAKIKKTVIQKPPGVTANDIFEINKKSGIANFLYEGDINLTEEQLNQLTESVAGDSNVSGARAKRGAALRDATKWPNGIVYYYFDTNITQNQMKVDAINAALQFLQAKTCIRLVYSNDSKVNPDRIKVIDGNGCHSQVGMIGGEQILSLGDGCEVIGSVAHEVAHALGGKHMHSRYDRDQYVTVYANKIMPKLMHDFVKLTINNSINYTPYEFGGMMQYTADTFSATPNIKNSSSFTMIPTDNYTNYLHTMGNTMTTFYDVKMINEHYNCSAKCLPATSANCTNGGVPNPNNCTTCNCPLGYGGALCDQMPPASGGCGGKLNATSAWQAKSFKYGENTTILRHQYTECHHWIKAPAGSKIQVRITNMTNPRCDYGCQFNGIEFKLKDQRMTNPKICCREFLHVIHTAELNPLPVIAHNRYGITEFTIEYRIDPAMPCSPCPPGNRNNLCCSIL